MKRNGQWMRRRALALAVAALGVVAIAGTALAGHQTSGVKSYRGCLVSGDGVMIKIKEGNAPRSACTGGQVEAHFSGGDITKISVGNGLSLPNGGDNGEVRIVLDASHSLPQNCTAGRVAEWNGSAWVCGVDNDTTYAAGTGLDLDVSETPDEVSIDPAYRLPGKTCPTAGQFARGFDSSGDIQCAAPSSTGVEVWHKTRPADFSGGVIVLPKGEGVDLITMPLPAGTFLMTAVAPVSERGSDDEVFVGCELRNGAFGPLPIQRSTVDIGDGSHEPTGTAAIHGVLTLASADTVRFTCTSVDGFGDDDPDQADSATMTAMKVGTLHTP